MHKLASTPITMDCFETGDYKPDLNILDIIDSDIPIRPISNYVESLIQFLENLRQQYQKTKNPRYWKELIRWLPESWLQTRSWTCNYENIRTICHQREGHKLIEWHQFIDWAKTLPYANEFIFYL